MPVEFTRVAEIRGPDTNAYGSGYLVSPRLVLTAKHVVQAAIPEDSPRGPSGQTLEHVLDSRPVDAPTCRVRLTTQAAFCDAIVVWWHPTEDVALLAADFADREKLPRLASVEWNDLDGYEGVKCFAYGWPASESRGPDGFKRDTFHLIGTIAPFTGHFRGLWSIVADDPVRKVSGVDSSWEGMSGAAVFTDQSFIGIVVSDPDPEDRSQRRLWALPARHFAELPDFASWLRVDAEPQAWYRGAPLSGKKETIAKSLTVELPKPRRGGLVGRGELESTIRRNLIRGENVAIHSGIAGAGKTALAAAVVHSPDIASTFSEGRLWLSVGKEGVSGLTHWTNRMALWGKKLDAPADEVAEAQASQDGERMKRLVDEAIGDRRMLLIFDDVWLREDALVFVDLGRNCTQLATTRIPRVATVFNPSPLRLNELDESAALELVERACPEAGQLFGDQLQEVLVRVSGLPLSLILVGQNLNYRLQNYGLEACLEFLRDVLTAEKRLRLEGDLAKSERPLLGEENLTLKALISLSAQNLKTNELEALRDIAAFPPKANSFSENAAAAVGGGADNIRALGDNGLLELVDRARSRYAMHQAIADFAHRGGEGDENAYRRMVEYFLQYIEALPKEKESERWVEELQDESENLRTALEWTVRSGESVLGLRLMAALWPYWYQRSLFQRARELADRVLAIPQAGPINAHELKLRADVLNSNGNFAYNMGDFGAALSLHQEALDIRNALGEEALTAGSINNIGLVLRERGNYDEAIEHFQRALTINERTKHDRWRLWKAMNLNNLGVAENRKGAYAASKTYQVEAVQTFREINNAFGLAMAQIDLADTLIKLGEKQDAENLLSSTLKAAWAAHDEKAVAAALRGFAALKLESHPSAAVGLLLSSIRFSAPLADRLGEAQAFEGLIHACARTGDVELGARSEAALKAYFEITGAAIPAHKRDLLADEARSLAHHSPKTYQSAFQASYQQAQRGLTFLLAALGHMTDVDPAADVQHLLSRESGGSVK